MFITTPASRFDSSATLIAWSSPSGSKEYWVNTIDPVVLFVRVEGLPETAKISNLLKKVGMTNGITALTVVGVVAG